MEEVRKKHRDALRLLNSQTGDSYYKIAKNAGVAASTISNTANDKGGMTALSARTIEKIKRFYPGFMGEAPASPRFEDAAMSPGLSIAEGNSPTWLLRAAQDLPILGTAAASDGKRITIDVDGEPIDYCTRPGPLQSKTDAYALYVVGTSMEPRFFEGDRIYVDPTRPARAKDDVVVQLIDNTNKKVNGLIKRLISKDDNKLTLEQFNPYTRIEIPTQQVASIHRVLTHEDLAG